MCIWLRSTFINDCRNLIRSLNFLMRFRRNIKCCIENNESHFMMFFLLIVIIFSTTSNKNNKPRVEIVCKLCQSHFPSHSHINGSFVSALRFSCSHASCGSTCRKKINFFTKRQILGTKKRRIFIGFPPERKVGGIWWTKIPRIFQSNLLQRQPMLFQPALKPEKWEASCQPLSRLLKPTASVSDLKTLSVPKSLD